MTILETDLLSRNRVTPLIQSEVAECGLICIAMVASFHGRDIELRELRRRHRTSIRGQNMSSLMEIADEHGFSGRLVTTNHTGIDKLQLPAILHYHQGHFVVVERVRRGRMLIHDPETGSSWKSFGEVGRRFSGTALEISPTGSFTSEKKRPGLRLTQLWENAIGLKRAIAQILALSVVLQLYVLFSPYFLQSAIDIALPALDTSLLTVIAIGFGLFTIVNAGATLLRSAAIAACGSALSYQLSINLSRHLLRLPIEWFERRHVGDILSRFQSVRPIQELLTSGGVSAMLDGVLTISTLVLMAFYSWKLTALAVIGFLIYGSVRLCSFRIQRDREEKSIVATAHSQSAMIENVRGISVLRALNCETTRHSVWVEKLAAQINAQFAVARVSMWATAANTLIFGLEGVASLWWAVGLVMSGGFSVGMVFAFFAYKTQFLARSASLIDQITTIRMTRLHLDRLSDIAFEHEDPSFRTAAAPRQEFLGEIELRKVSYSYGGDSAPAVDAVSLLLEPGEHIAITGASAAGKTTLVKLLLGLIEPQSGEILVDGMPLALFGHRNYRAQVGSVLQDDTLFAGSIANNITFFDEFPDMNGITHAAVQAQIHDEIMGMPMRYNSLVGDMGSSLSGGQRQRLLLARALYRNPRMLILDEGTSHLDSSNENAINRAVSEMGITRIVIAHRVETVASAQKVYVMSNGRIAGPV